MKEGKIAIPADDGILSAHFGHCRQFHVFEIRENEVAGKQVLSPPQHEPGILPRWIHGLGVTDLIAGGIGQRAIDLFQRHGVNVHTGAPFEPAEKIVEDFLKGRLQTSSNYCDH